MWCARVYGCPDLAYTLYVILLPLILLAFLVYDLRHRLWKRAFGAGIALLAWFLYLAVATLRMVGHQCKVNCSGVEQILPGLGLGAIVVGVLVKNWLRDRSAVRRKGTGAVR